MTVSKPVDKGVEGVDVVVVSPELLFGHWRENDDYNKGELSYKSS